MILALTVRNIDSPELEHQVVKKLDEENIYRYLDLKQTVKVFLALSKHKRFINHSLFVKLQKVIYEQKNYYSHFPELLRDIREGMAAVEQSAGENEEPIKIEEAYKQIN